MNRDMDLEMAMRESSGDSGHLNVEESEDVGDGIVPPVNERDDQPPQGDP
jgi:hypothetical protein